MIGVRPKGTTMAGFEAAILSAVMGLGFGLTAAYFIRRWRDAARAKKLASMPKVYASRQEMRKEERARLKAERSARKRG
jgi:ribose 5-phosphate isomerase